MRLSVQYSTQLSPSICVRARVIARRSVQKKGKADTFSTETEDISLSIKDDGSATSPVVAIVRIKNGFMRNEIWSP